VRSRLPPHARLSVFASTPQRQHSVSGGRLPMHRPMGSRILVEWTFGSVASCVQPLGGPSRRSCSGPPGAGCDPRSKPRRPPAGRCSVRRARHAAAPARDSPRCSAPARIHSDPH